MTAAWLAAGGQGGSGPVLGRVVLVAVVMLAVGTFAVLQAKARSGRRGRPPGHEEQGRPGWRYGYPPGYEPYPLHDPDRSPWAVRGDRRP